MKSNRIALVFVVALVLAACGDTSTSSDSPVATSGAAPPATTTSAPPTIPPPPTTAPATTTTTAPAATTTVPAVTTVPPTTAAVAGDVAALRAAIAKNSAVTSGRMEGVFEIVGIEGVPEGTEIAMTFSGAFDNEAGAFSFVMDLGGFGAVAGDEVPPGFADLLSEMELRQIGDTTYMRFPVFGALLGVETDWISFPTDQSGSPASGFAAGSPVNPTEFLATFEAVGASVAEVGQETVRGFDTTRFRVIFDVDELRKLADPEQLADLENMGPLPIDQFPMDIWVDADGLVHRFEIVFDGAAADLPSGSGFERMTTRFDLLDHGAPIEIEAPPADEVTDGSQFIGVFGA